METPNMSAIFAKPPAPLPPAPPPPNPEDLAVEAAMAAHIDALEPGQRAVVLRELIALKAQVQAQDTNRFLALSEGDAEKLRATARPEIARRAMGVIETFALVFKVVFLAIVLEWAVRTGSVWLGAPLPAGDSLTQMLAGLSPVAEMIWAPLLGSFWASVEIVKKYMGVRERDKAHEFEIRHGAPLHSTQATIEAAGGTVAQVIRAFRR
jgi:hypothetical protein